VISIPEAILLVTNTRAIAKVFRGGIAVDTAKVLTLVPKD
jgi:hypothetical protein